MIETSRRSLITGLVALVAAPAIVKVASLMPVNAALQPGNNLLTLNEFNRLNQFTREAARRFRDSNEFIRNINAQFAEDRVFYEGEQWDKVWLEAVDNQDARIGSTLRIRLPNDYIVSDGPNVDVLYGVKRMWSDPAPVALGPVVLAAAAVAVAPAMLEKPVTRRFWGK